MVEAAGCMLGLPEADTGYTPEEPQERAEEDGHSEVAGLDAAAVANEQLVVLRSRNSDMRWAPCLA